MGGRYTATDQGFFKERGDGSVVLAVAHPWASASSYLSSQSVADSRCHLYAAPRSSYPRRSRSCRFFLCRAALLCLRVAYGVFEGPTRFGRRVPGDAQVKEPNGIGPCGEEEIRTAFGAGMWGGKESCRARGR